MRLLRLHSDGLEDAEERHARHQMTQAGLAALDRIEQQQASGPDGARDALPSIGSGFVAAAVKHLRAEYSHLAHRFAPDGAVARVHDDEQRAAAKRGVREQMLDAERREVIRLRDESVISDGVMRRLQRDLDLEELLLDSEDTASARSLRHASPLPTPETDDTMGSHPFGITRSPSALWELGRFRAYSVIVPRFLIRRTDRHDLYSFSPRHYHAADGQPPIHCGGCGRSRDWTERRGGTLLEYGDFECLHCARAFPIIRQLRIEMPDTIRLVFRHFPLGWEHRMPLSPLGRPRRRRARTSSGRCTSSCTRISAFSTSRRAGARGDDRTRRRAVLARPRRPRDRRPR